MSHENVGMAAGMVLCTLRTAHHTQRQLWLQDRPASEQPLQGCDAFRPGRRHALRLSRTLSAALPSCSCWST